ncbi:MAG: hypothetical protein ACI8T1_002760 [Verrucomicrobiales bacterium]|jgi:hypothetical protein
MKSAYEIAMERLSNDGTPKVVLTEEQRDKLGELDNLYMSKVAEKEVFLSDLIAKAMASGDYAEVALLEEQKRREIARIEEKCEFEKDKVRAS